MDKEYIEYLKTDQWKLIKSKVLERDNNRCNKCESTDKLHIHHKNYDSIFNESLDDLITLCKVCHYKHHSPDYRKGKLKRLVEKKVNKQRVKPNKKKARRKAIRKKENTFLNKFK